MESVIAFPEVSQAFGRRGHRLPRAVPDSGSCARVSGENAAEGPAVAIRPLARCLRYRGPLTYDPFSLAREVSYG